tara:strand:- start:231 stop:416 length:186 start_codon:yes stop_codon:yes gene_type:complete
MQRGETIEFMAEEKEQPMNDVRSAILNLVIQEFFLVYSGYSNVLIRLQKDTFLAFDFSHAR